MKWIKRKIILWLFGYDFPRYVRQFYKEQDQIIKMYSEMLREEEKLLRWLKIAEDKRCKQWKKLLGIMILIHQEWGNQAQINYFG